MPNPSDLTQKQQRASVHNKKVKLIVNPTSGEGMILPPFFQKLFGVRQSEEVHHTEPKELVEHIKTYLNDYGIEPQVEVTQREGHATELTRQCVGEGYDLVIAAGGDGTINEVVNALAGTGVTLGVIPLGTANIFALQMGLPLEPKEACRVIAQGARRRIDLGKAGNRYFSCMAGIGFDAFVLRETSRDFKRKWGALSYVFTAFARFVNYKFRRIIVRIDGEKKTRRGYFLLVSNGKYYAGEKIIADKAELSDGMLDVSLFRHRNLWGLFSYLLGIRQRDALKEAKQVQLKCKRLKVLKNGRHPVHVDAEFLRVTPIDIEVVPGALRVAVDKE